MFSLFKYIIIKKDELKKIQKESFENGVKKTNLELEKEIKPCIESLLKLKQDHWDKMEFDRLILNLYYLINNRSK